jgi:hypothetical protein
MNIDNIPLSDFEKQIFRCRDTATGLVRLSSTSAYVHLEKAWHLSDIDKEMSLFRAITAEEEMATAIFIALRNLGYRNAKRLNRKNHIHKQGLYPFCSAIWSFLDPSQTSDVKAQLYIEQSELPKLKLKFLLPGNYTLTPEPPLNQKAMRDDNILYKFERELIDYTEAHGADTIQKHLTDIAKLRNTMLYAHNNSLPSFDGEIEAELMKKTNIVANLARLLCLIFPYKERSALVQQCLDVYSDILSTKYPKTCECNESV